MLTVYITPKFDYKVKLKTNFKRHLLLGLLGLILLLESVLIY